MGFKSGQFQDQSNNPIFFFSKKFLTTLLLLQGAPSFMKLLMNRPMQLKLFLWNF